MSAAVRSYALHGYTLTTDVPLRLPSADVDDSRAGDSATSLTVITGAARTVPDDGPDGELLARLAGEEGTYYSFARSERLVLRFHGLLELDADPGLRRAVLHPHPGTDPGAASVLLPGTVIATRLMLDGRLVLHSSALDVDGAAVAFAGPPGAGKSTLAALGMLAGYRMVSDDVLRVDLAGAPGGGADDAPAAVVWPGASSARLRPGAAELARGFGPGQVGTTADGRVAFGTADDGAVPVSALPLRCIVLPVPDRSARDVMVKRTGPLAALRELVASPRIIGWSEPTALRRQFDGLADLVDRVPVLEATVPWGPPFPSELMRRLLGTVFEAVERGAVVPQR
jgi:hypothetical protein